MMNVRTRFTSGLKMRNACFIALLGVGLQLTQTNSHAQISSATVNGTVRDTTGAVIPDAAVVLRNVQTGINAPTSTNDQGIYVLQNILPGTYTLEASKPGFSTSRLEPFTLVVNQASVFDLQLQVGKVQESVS